MGGRWRTLEEPGVLAALSSTHTAALSPRCGSVRRCSSWGTLPSRTPKAHPQPPSGFRPPSQHRSISSWASSITVPQPFRMTLREARKKAQWLASPASFEPERRQAEKQGQEEAECHRQFRAQPVPAHVYLPLYQEVMERNEARRRAGIQKRKELLLSSLKPFSFLEKEEQRKQAALQRHLAATAATAKVPKQKATRRIPKSILEPALGEKLQGKDILNLPAPSCPEVPRGCCGGVSRAQGSSWLGDGLFGGGPTRDLVQCRPRPRVGLGWPVQWRRLVGRGVGGPRFIPMTSSVSVSECHHLCGSTGAGAENH